MTDKSYGENLIMGDSRERPISMDKTFYSAHVSVSGDSFIVNVRIKASATGEPNTWTTLNNGEFMTYTGGEPILYDNKCGFHKFVGVFIEHVTGVYSYKVEMT